MNRLLKSMLYMPKHSKPTDETILRLLIPSVVGIVLCMVCLAGTTWAWFTIGIQSAPQTITAANFDVAVSITDDSGTPVVPDEPLTENKKYTVVLTASGSAPSGGYCVMEGDGTKHYTTPVKPGETLQFTLIPETPAVYSFTAVWGRYSGTPDISQGDIIGELVSEPSPSSLA